MAAEKTWSVNLHLDEVVALISLARIVSWPGLVLPEEIDDRKKVDLMDSGVRSLADRGFLASSAEGKPCIHAGLMFVISVITRPQKVLLARGSNCQMQRWLFISSTGLVEQEYFLDRECLCLTAVNGTDELAARTFDHFRLPADISNDLAGFKLDFSKILDAAKNGEASVRAALTNMHTPEPVISELVEIFCGGQQFKALLTYDEHGVENFSRRISWFSSIHGLWQMQRENECEADNLCLFKPVSPVFLRDTLTACFDQE